MRILVTGGTGCLGREVVPRCLHRGWTVRVMSRRPRAAGRPILRATQFYPLVDTAMSWLARLPVLAGPAGISGRPVDPAEVAERLAAAVEAGPSLAVAEFAGPEVLTFAELSAQWLEVTGRHRRRMITLPVPGDLGRAFRAGRAVPASGELGTQTWRSWLTRRYHHRIPR